ncbi:MAG: sodium/proline symporter PutP [Sphaerochaetaceae bacterium]|nr:sodium/proline symporter PutP [Sphaerochaetaceae bacterium]
MTIVAFVIYFAAMLGIGIYFFLKDKNTGEKDYFLGGRKMGPWVTAMSAQASDMSAWLLMGLPGSMVAFGFGAAWIGIGLVLGTVLNWVICAKRLRKFSKVAGDSITLPQYLTNRFCEKSHVLSVVCAIVFLISFTIYVASGFVAGATVFTTLIPSLNQNVAMLIFALILIVYTFLGGFSAVCWTDFVQGTLMLIAMIAVPIVVLCSEQMNPEALTKVYSYQGTEYRFVTSFFSASWQDIVTGLGWGLGYFGMPHILVRFMAIEKPSMIKKSATVAIIWVTISLVGAIVIAYFGRMFFAEELLTTGNQKLVFIVMAKKYFPAFIAGILLSAIIAASMSTADSQLLVASSSFTSDIYKPCINPKATDNQLMWIGRGVVVVVSVVAFFIASNKGSAAQAIMELVENAWGLFGASFGPVILLSLFWRRFTYHGAVAGIIAGALMDILWLLFCKGTGIYEIIPGFLFGLVTAICFSLAQGEPGKKVTDIFDTATDPKYND